MRNELNVIDQQMSLNQINKTTYSRADVVKYYQNKEPLLKTEEVLFEKLSATLSKSVVLDIGIGGGRTTKHLLPMCKEYIGVDYVPEFAEATAKKYPNAKIICSDATDLKEFEAESVDFVFFSYNGIDSITNEQRLLVFSEANRVLRKGGTLMFSTHNRDYVNFDKLPWQRQFEFDKNFIHFLLYSMYHLPKHFKMKKHEVFNDEYAIVNDGDHRYSLLLYYISISKQIEQLNNFGFGEVEAFDMDGNLVKTDTKSHWIHYISKKQ